jgi:hypothetical protein
MPSPPGLAVFLQDLEHQALGRVARYRSLEQHARPLLFAIVVGVGLLYYLLTGGSAREGAFVLVPLVLFAALLGIFIYSGSLKSALRSRQFAEECAAARVNLVDGGLLKLVQDPEACIKLPSLNQLPAMLTEWGLPSTPTLAGPPVSPDLQQRIGSLIEHYGACCAEAGQAGLTGIAQPRLPLGRPQYLQTCAVAVEVARALRAEMH